METQNEKKKRGRPFGSKKPAKMLLHVRVMPETSAWLMQNQTSARSVHHAASLILDQLAIQQIHQNEVNK